MKILKIIFGTPEAKAIAKEMHEANLKRVETVSNSVITPAGLQEIKLMIAGRDR